MLTVAAILLRVVRRILPIAVALLLALPAAASASGPRLTVPKADLAAALHCPIDPAGATRTPLMYVTGTGATGAQGYLIGQRAFEAYGHPVCYVDFPDYTTADIQVSVQYLVYAIRKEFRVAGRKVAMIGISQGGLLPRFALTYWPDLRRKVSDVVAAAGTQHGTTVFHGCSATAPCTPAGWQQIAGLASARRPSTRSRTRLPGRSPTRRSARSPTRRCSPRTARTRRRRCAGRGTS